MRPASKLKAAHANYGNPSLQQDTFNKEQCTMLTAKGRRLLILSFCSVLLWVLFWQLSVFEVGKLKVFADIFKEQARLQLKICFKRAASTARNDQRLLSFSLSLRGVFGIHRQVSYAKELDFPHALWPIQKIQLLLASTAAHSQAFVTPFKKLTSFNINRIHRCTIERVHSNRAPKKISGTHKTCSYFIYRAKGLLPSLLV